MSTEQLNIIQGGERVLWVGLQDLFEEMLRFKNAFFAVDLSVEEKHCKGRRVWFENRETPKNELSLLSKNSF